MREPLQGWWGDTGEGWLVLQGGVSSHCLTPPTIWEAGVPAQV